MTRRHKHITNAAKVCLLALPLACQAQNQNQTSTPVQSAPATTPKPLPAVYRNVIVLDPAHGGDDTGAHLTNALEKDVTLAFVARLRPLLAAAGFTVISTHDGDADLTTDQRAGIANRARPAACLVIHATSSGSGVHIATSALSDDSPIQPRGPIPWDTAQTASLPQSLRLANELGLALDHAKLPVLLTRASVRPLDNLTCPAAAVELAPVTALTDVAFQQQAAQAIVAALTSYRSHSAPPAATPATSSPGNPGAPR